MNCSFSRSYTPIRGHLQIYMHKDPVATCSATLNLPQSLEKCAGAERFQTATVKHWRLPKCPKSTYFPDAYLKQCVLKGDKRKHHKFGKIIWKSCSRLGFLFGWSRWLPFQETLTVLDEGNINKCIYQKAICLHYPHATLQQKGTGKRCIMCQ